MNELQLLVQSFSNYAQINNFVFSHGLASEFNQKEYEGNNPSNGEVFLHLYEVEPTPDTSDLYIDFGVFRVNFFIGMKSLLSDQFYGANKGVKGINYRYDKYFVPLYDHFKGLVNNIHVCDNINTNVNSVTKRINYLDHNLDGYLVNATMIVYV